MAEVLDAVQELLRLIEESRTRSAPVSSEERLPAIISGGPMEFSDADERDWLIAFTKLKAANSNIAKGCWESLARRLDNWVVVLLAGSILGVLIGLGYRWMLPPI